MTVPQKPIVPMNAEISRPDLPNDRVHCGVVKALQTPPQDFKRSQSNIRGKATGPCVTSNLRQIFDRTDDLIGKAVVDRLGC